MSLIARLTAQSQYEVSIHCRSSIDAADPTTLAHTTLNDGNDLSYLYTGDYFGTVDSFFATCEFTDMPLAISIEGVTANWRESIGGGGGGLAPGESNFTRAYFEKNGTKYYSPSILCVDGFPPPVNARSYTWPADPSTGNAWTHPVVNSGRFGVNGYSVGYPVFATSPLIAELTVDVSYLPVPAEVEAARDVASRRVWLRRRPSMKVTLRGPARWLLLVPGTRIDLEHIAGPHATGNGWEDQAEERRPLWVESQTWNPDDMSVTLVCVDHRPKLCTMYDSGYATAAGVARDGLMRMGPGAIWTMSRASTAEMLDATGQLVSVPADVEAFSDRGQVIQRVSKNLLLNSGFGLGVDTHWTSSGEGSNGSNITAETQDGLWTADLSPQCLKIQAGSPIHAADLQHQADATESSFNFGVPWCVSIYHKDEGGPLSYAIQRTAGTWWRASDGTWQAAKTWNALPQRSTWYRDDATFNISFGTSSGFTLFVGVPTTGAAGQMNKVAHAQIERSAFPLSPIFTLATTVSRAQDVLRVSNNLVARILHAAQFTVMHEVEPFWAAGQISGALPVAVLFDLEHDANNSLVVTWTQSDSRWHAILTTAGVATDASAADSPVRGVRKTITVRLTGPRGELGLAPRTLAIYVDGVIGDTTAVAPQQLVEVGTSYLEYALFDGCIRQRFFSPQVLTDKEILRGI